MNKCMNEWNSIPIIWLSDASLKAQGQEPVVSLLTSGVLCRPTPTHMQFKGSDAQIIVDVHLNLRQFC